jgi:lipopolysaccharide/colanic/teichoic acid biosynthesis glycosyltransferase
MIVSEINPVSPASGTIVAAPAPPAGPRNRILKRASDIVIGSLLAVLTAPIILIAMVLVRLTSKGPSIYTQVRLGRGNRSYTIYKIRTMYQNCEADSGPKWSTKGDSRVTRVGRFLRSTHIDELPQLWNVLRGEMSLVGPRPERPEIATNLELVIPCYGERLQVRPGLTGLAQVQLPPDASLADVRRKLACDLYYIRYADFWLDFRILLSTGTYVMGIPFRFPRDLLRIPSGEAVEAVYHGRGDVSARIRVA